jgi:UDP:flavonoid glycosyltransferase YjiC (YdhE family)
VPILGIASNMDQHLTMSAVEQAGAGIRLRAEYVTQPSLQRTIGRLLDQPVYRTEAKRLASEYKQFDAVTRFRDFVDSTEAQD